MILHLRRRCAGELLRRLDTIATIHAPERVTFHHELAGPGPRAAAWFADVLVQLTVVVALFMAWVMALVAFPSLAGLGEVLSGVSTALALIAAFGMRWFYAASFEWWFVGQTPGKMLARIRVVQSEGAPIRWNHALLRNVLRAVDALPGTYLMAVAVMLVDSKQRRLGDLLAGTMVVQVQRSGAVERVPIVPPVSPEERAALPAGLTLSAAELAAVELLLRRADQLPDGWAETFAQQLAPQLQAREGVQAPTALRVLTLAYAGVTGRVGTEA